jgi:hypothetical protein
MLSAGRSQISDDYEGAVPAAQLRQVHQLAPADMRIPSPTPTIAGPA